MPGEALLCNLPAPLWLAAGCCECPAALSSKIGSLGTVTALQLISGMCCIRLSRNNNFCDLLHGGLQAGYSLLIAKMPHAGARAASTPPPLAHPAAALLTARAAARRG